MAAVVAHAVAFDRMAVIDQRLERGGVGCLLLLVIRRGFACLLRNPAQAPQLRVAHALAEIFDSGLHLRIVAGQPRRLVEEGVAVGEEAVLEEVA